MRKLSGKVTCSKENMKINKDAIISVNLVNSSLADAPAVHLNGIKLTGIETFPFEFELEFDDAAMLSRRAHDYSICIRIETNGKLNFINDTHFSPIDAQSGSFLDHLDMFVIPVGQN